MLSPVTVCVPVTVIVSVDSSPKVRLPLTTKLPSAVILPLVVICPFSPSTWKTVADLPILKVPSYRVGSLVPAILNESDFIAPSCVNSNLSLVVTPPTDREKVLPDVVGPDSFPTTRGINACPTLYPKPPEFISTSFTKPTLVTVYEKFDPLPPTLCGSTLRTSPT